VSCARAPLHWQEAPERPLMLEIAIQGLKEESI
jgi:hypothetical protein